MPRINFEDSVWLDVRFSQLVVELAKRYNEMPIGVVRQLAVGALITMWRTAQEYWTDKHDPHSPIPEAIWKRNHFFDELMVAGFAEKTDDGIRAMGSKDAFEWIENNQTNGQKGGKAKKPNDCIKRSEANRSEPKRSEASSSSSFSSSFSNTNTNTNTNTVSEEILPDAVAPAARKKAVKKEPTEGTEVWNAYSEAMEASWGLKPPRSAKTAGQAKQLVGLVGLDDAKKLAAYYPTRRSSFYVAKGHPFGLLLSDHMALLRELRAGLKMTKEVVDSISSKEDHDNHEAFRKLKPSIYDEDYFEKMEELSKLEQERETRVLLSQTHN